MFAEPECEFTGRHGSFVSQLIHKKGQAQYTDKCSILTKSRLASIQS